MSSNPTPWIVMIGLVLAVLAWRRGYIKLPSFASSTGTAVTPTQVAVEVGHTLMDVTKLTSHELGVLFAQRQKLEAELETAHEFATAAGDSLKAAFKSPFASAAPAPANPPSPAPGA